MPPKSTCLLAAALVALAPVVAASAESARPAQRPNILLVVADDLGYTDIGPYGAEIDTPNLDALAREGVTFTRFYTSPLCSPTRAMLMSGTDSHLAGLAKMAEHLQPEDRGKPGYEGYLNNRVAPLPELLRDAGYHTYMVGKWHLGTEVDLTPKARGFERAFSLLTGSSSHFDEMAGPRAAHPRALFAEDGRRLSGLPATFYSTEYFTDRLLEYIDANIDDGRPFFGYLSYTAPHWPLQVPEEHLAKYRGKYDAGYEKLRAERFARLKALGLLPKSATLPPLPKHVPTWDSLPAEEKARQARAMEIYAAMVHNMDAHLGRVLAYLRRRGVYENTFVFFMSDNGADGQSSAFAPIADWAATFDNRPENMGRRGSYVLYEAGWAHAAEAPFRLYKWFTSEGGIRTPAIAAYSHATARGATHHGVVSVLDVLPTFLDLAGARHPGTHYRGREINPPRGRSILPLLADPARSIRASDDVFATEILGRRALVKGDWKILWLDEPFGTAAWQLYNLATDPGEQNDLAAREPARLAALLADWDRYAASSSVDPMASAGAPAPGPH